MRALQGGSPCREGGRAAFPEGGLSRRPRVRDPVAVKDLWAGAPTMQSAAGGSKSVWGGSEAGHGHGATAEVALTTTWTSSQFWRPDTLREVWPGGVCRGLSSRPEAGSP